MRDYDCVELRRVMGCKEINNIVEVNTDDKSQIRTVQMIELWINQDNMKTGYHDICLLVTCAH